MRITFKIMVAVLFAMAMNARAVGLLGQRYASAGAGVIFLNDGDLER